MNTPTSLRPFFEPGGIALFGASPTPGTLGHGIWHNLQDCALTPQLHCINPRHTSIAGQVCMPDLEAVAHDVRLALIATPLAQAGPILQACAARKVRAAVLYGAFAQTDTPDPTDNPGWDWSALGGMRVWGPRALGYALPHRDINLFPIRKKVPRGKLGFISQSNAVCAAVLDWQHNDEFGYSAVFCPGQGRDVDLPELINYLATDIHTESILMYLEGVRDARPFLSAVRAAASVKPVIVVKAGQHSGTQRLVQRHLDLPVGDDAAFDAALRRCGALRVPSIGDMFSAARALGNVRKPRGNRLGVISNGGGPLVMAADAAARHQVELARVADGTICKLQQTTPQSWGNGNPVDVLFDTDATRYAAALRVLLDDPGVDGVLGILTPNTFVDPLAVAQATIDTAQHSDKPVLGCWMGETEVRPARARFARERMASFRTPESAVVGFGFLVDWVRSQAQLQETPPAHSAYQAPDLEQARQVMRRALDRGQTRLEGDSVGQLLAAFHIPSTLRAPPPQGRWAQVSIRRDPVFGPVLLVRENSPHAPTAYALPPLNTPLVAQLMQQASLAQLVDPDRPYATQVVQGLQHVLLRLSEMASELPWLQSLHMACLAVHADSVSASEVDIQIAPAPDSTPQYRHMAICPYPSQCVVQTVLRDGSALTLRPIRPEDASTLQDFVRALSRRSKYYRFFNTIHELPQKMLVRYTQVDYAREMTMVALTTVDGQPAMVGEANYATLADGQTCEFAVVVADAMAGKGLGAALMGALMDAARAYGLVYIEGEVLANNEPMLALMEALGFSVQYTDEETVRVSRPL